MRLEANDVAIVTGAASGIGFGLAEAFVQQGLRVAMVDRDEDALTDAVTQVARDGEAGVLPLVADVSSQDDMVSVVDAAYSSLGPVKILCNNAGVLVKGPVWRIAPERYRWAFDVNIMGVVHGIHACVPRMLEQGVGYVVNTASAAGLIVKAGQGPYSASKHAVIGLTESLRLDLEKLGSSGVRCAVLCPEFVRTHIADSAHRGPGSAEEITSSFDAAEEAVFVRNVKAGLAPSQVARAVLRAIDADAYWIFPHETTIGRAQAHWQEIAAAAESFPRE